DAVRFAATQQLEAGAIDPEHSAVRSDFQEALERVLEEVAELAIPIGQGALHHGAPLYFPRERPPLLLQLRDELEPRLRRGVHVALGGYDTTVLRADPVEAAQIRRIGPFRQRIRAIERETFALAELVPQLLELHGCLLAAVPPQQGHHLAEGDHPRV